MPSRVTIPFESQVFAGFVVFFAPTGNGVPDPESLRPFIASWREQRLKDPLRTAVATFQDREVVSLEAETAERIPMPPVEVLRYLGLGELEERVLGAATHAFVVSCPDLNVAPRIGLWASLATALAVADRLEGIVFDPEALRIVKQEGAAGWFTERGKLAASQHIIVPFSVGQDSGLGWMTTRGMGKFGLPDLELRDVPPNLSKLNVLMNSVAQLLIEAALERSRESNGEATASVELATPVEVDASTIARANGRAPEAESSVSAPIRVGLSFDRGGREPEPPMIRLHAPDRESDPGLWLNRVAQTLLGGSRDVRMVRTGSERMQEAHDKAMSELPYAKQRFAAGLRAGELLYVKKGFDTRSGSKEYLWLVVTGWAGTQVRAQLANQPSDIPSLTIGQTVSLDQVDVFDWLIQMPGGRSEGGHTARVTLEEGQE